MIALVFTACIASALPEVCRDFELVFLEQFNDVTPQQCMIYGQPQLANWQTEHPGFRIKRFKCVKDDKKKLDI